jgi:hypothetical protein
MFDDIRPFRDNEVTTVINKLINEDEFQASVAQLVMPRLYRLAPWFAKKTIKVSLKFRTKSFTTINQIHLEVAKYLKGIIHKSAKGFSCHGLENFDVNKPALFISNHRDIVLDAALVNLALYEKGLNTAESAVGDNLLTTSWVADLMRLNKSFIVKRSETTKREMLQAAKTLSAYIHHSITQSKQNIWIAQREGRAKDGLDKTNPALISMLLLNKDKTTAISDYLAQINIIPVAISYEFDPCDNQKAIELATKESTGEYNKKDNEDLSSITKGLLGQKGRIHLEFCRPLQGDFQNSKAVASAIDQQIIGHYKLFSSNYAAFAHLNDKFTDHLVLKKLKERMKGLDELQQHWLLTMYANPVLAKLSLNQCV